MANDYVGVADMVADALNLSGAELSELKNAAPVLAALPALQASDGDYHRYSKYTQEPVVNFRAENAGRDFDHSVDTIVNLELKILDWSFAVDKAVADRRRQGGASAWIAREGMRHLKAAMFAWEESLFYGSGAHTGAFGGLLTNTDLDALADEMVVDAGGSGVGLQTSCYLLRANPAEIAAVYKGSSFEMGETVVQNFTDGSSLNYPAYYTPACSWVACQHGSKYSAARIANIEPGTTELTDDMIYDAMSRFPAGMEPNMIVMNRGAQESLRGTRTATNIVGAPAPNVMEVAGIPVITTDALTQTEAVEV